MSVIHRTNEIDMVVLPHGGVEIIKGRRSVCVSGIIYYSLRNDVPPLMIDASDRQILVEFTWRPLKAKMNNWYVHSQTKRPERTPIYLHRYLVKAERGQLVDHWNGNGLDCRRLNLRITDHTGNARNKVSVGKFGFRGVKVANNSKTPFYASICVDGKYIRYGVMFPTPHEAAAAYDEMARKYFKTGALLNFPSAGERGLDRSIVGDSHGH